MSFARSIDNLLSYFKEILAEVILKEPKILRSKEVERLDFIFKYDSMEGLMVAIAEKKIESLFYGGIDKIETYFKDKLGVEIFKSDEEKEEINFAIKARNIIVHNRGVVSKSFKKQFPEMNFEEGAALSYTYEDISLINALLTNLVGHLDYEISNKFNLELMDSISVA